jgi:hypothetical protein
VKTDFSDRFDEGTLPEPATVLLLGMCLVGLAIRR